MSETTVESAERFAGRMGQIDQAAIDAVRERDAAVRRAALEEAKEIVVGVRTQHLRDLGPVYDATGDIINALNTLIRERQAAEGAGR